MATWLSKNTRITQNGQLLLNRCSLGDGKLVITRVVSSDKFYSGEHPYEASELGNEKQELIGVRYFPAPNSKTAYMLEAQLDNKVEHIDGTEDMYYLRQIGIFAKIEGESEEVLLMYAECLRVGENPNEEKGDADTVPSITDAHVVQTYAFQLNNFEEFDGKVEVVVSGAGMLTRTQMEQELDERYTNPMLVGSAIIGDKLLVPDAFGRLVETGVLKEFDIDTSVRLYSLSGYYSSTYQPTFTFNLNTYAQTSGKHLISTLVHSYKIDKLTSSDFITLENKTTGEKKQFVFKDWVNYVDSTTEGVFTLTADFDLTEGVNEFEYTLSSGLSYLLTSLRLGNTLTSSYYHITYSPINCDYNGMAYLNFVDIVFNTIDDDIKSYLPIPLCKSINTSSPSMVDRLVTEASVAEIRESIVSKSIGYSPYEFKGFISTLSRNFTANGWYTLDFSEDNTPSDLGLPTDIDDLSSYLSFMIKIEGSARRKELRFKKYKHFEEGVVNFRVGKTTLFKGKPYRIYVQSKSATNVGGIELLVNGKLLHSSYSSTLAPLYEVLEDETKNLIETVYVHTFDFIPDESAEHYFDVQLPPTTSLTKLPDLMGVSVFDIYNESTVNLSTFADTSVSGEFGALSLSDLKINYALSSTNAIGASKQTLYAFKSGANVGKSEIYERFAQGVRRGAWSKHAKTPLGQNVMYVDSTDETLGDYIPLVDKDGSVVTSNILMMDVQKAVDMAKNPPTVAFDTVTLTGDEPAGTLQFVVTLPSLDDVTGIVLNYSYEGGGEGPDGDYMHPSLCISSGTITFNQGKSEDISGYLDSKSYTFGDGYDLVETIYLNHDAEGGAYYFDIDPTSDGESIELTKSLDFNYGKFILL